MKHGSQVHQPKIKQQEVWCLNERSPSTAKLPLSSVPLWNIFAKCDVWWKRMCVCGYCMFFPYKCLQSLTHHAPFMTKHLHTPVPGVMQETVHCCTNQQLCRLLAVCLSCWKQTLSNATPIRDRHSGRAVLWKLLYLGALDFGSIWSGFMQNHWMFERNISGLLF